MAKKNNSQFLYTLENIKELSESEKSERLLRLQFEQNKKTERILNNVLWFFWLSIAIFIMLFIAFMELMDAMGNF